MLRVRRLSARRRLIASISIVAALFALSYINNSRGIVAQVTNDRAVVGVAKTPTTSPTDVEVKAAVREAIMQAGGLPDEVGPGKKVVIQPNLVEAGWPSSSADPGVPYCPGVVTDVRVVRAIVEMCIEAGTSVNDITICEGSAGFREGTTHSGYDWREATKKAYYDAGFDRNRDMIDDATGVRLVDANHVRNDVNDVYPPYPYGQEDGYDLTHITKVQYPNGSLVGRNYFIPKCVAECDVLIRVPVLKTHDLAGYTGGLKLAFGVAPSDIYHVDFHWPGWDENKNKTMKWNLLHQQAWGYNQLDTNTRGMVDMTIARPPDMVVIDGLVGITTGPTRNADGKNVPGTASPYMSCIIASHDVVAADTVGTLAIGYRVSSIPGINEAANQGLGQNQPAFIDIRGVALADFRQWWSEQPNSDSQTGIPGNPSPPYINGLTVTEGAHVGGKLLIKPKYLYIPNGVCKTELYVDGEFIREVLNTSAITWDASTVSEGTHQFTYTLYDMMLNKTSVSRNVTVHRGNSISAILNQPDNTPVFLGPVYSTGNATTVDTRTIFVSTADGVTGMKLVFSSTAPTWPSGYEVSVNGTLTTVNGQRVLTGITYTNGSTQPISSPRLFSNAALGGSPLEDFGGVYLGTGVYNLGSLVRTAGKVSAGGSNYFYIDDGSLSSDRAGASKLKVYSGSITQPIPGKVVSLTGWSCTDTDGGVIRRMLILRYAADIKPYN